MDKITILDFFRDCQENSDIVYTLAETMPEFISRLQERISRDMDYKIEAQRNAIENDTFCCFQTKSFAIQMLTLSDKKIKKLIKKDINEVDVDVLSNKLLLRLKRYLDIKKFHKCSYQFILYPEIGEHGNKQLHYHGYFYGDIFVIDNMLRWWRRNYGYAKYKELSGHDWYKYCEKHPIINPIRFEKTYTF